MDVVTRPGSLFTDDAKFEHGRLMLGATFSYSCAPGALDATVGIASSVLAKAILRKHRRFQA